MKFHKIWRHPNIMSIMRHRDCHNMLRAKVSWSRVHVAWIQRCPAWQTKRNWPTNTNCLKSNDIHRCWHPLIWNLHVPCQNSTRSHVFFWSLETKLSGYRQIKCKSNVQVSTTSLKWFKTSIRAPESWCSVLPFQCDGTTQPELTTLIRSDGTRRTLAVYLYFQGKNTSPLLARWAYSI
jgi:hypothetical protein